MELRQLAHFVAVADELHFTRAAGRVHVGQSSLSASIHALETDIGAQLFVRDSRHVRLTPAGRALLPAARRALAAADEARDAVSGARGVLRGRLDVGAIQTLGVVDLAALLARYGRTHPRVDLRLTHDAAPVLARAVGDSELDVAFVDGPTDARRVRRIELGHDDLILAAPREHHLAKRERIRLDAAELRDCVFIGYRADSALQAQVDVACAAAGLVRRTRCEAQNMQYLSELVAHGLGVAIVPAASVRAVRASVATVAITPPLRRHICAVVSATVPMTAPARALIDLLAEQLRQERPHPLGRRGSDQSDATVADPAPA